MLLEDNWVPDENLQIDVKYIKNMWNCFDESALEMMLKLSDLSEGFNVLYNLEALTIGNSKCDTYLRTLYALGYKKAVRVEYDDDLRFKPEMIAGTVAGYVNKKQNIDVVVMGRQTSDGNNEKTPLILAEYLGWPCITQVMKLEPVDENYIKVINETDEGVLTQVVKTPCVISVGNVSESYLRVPTLKDRMKLGKQPIELYTPKELYENEKDIIEMVELCNIEKVDNTRNGIIIEGNTPKEKAYKLYNEYLKERLEKL